MNKLTHHILFILAVFSFSGCQHEKDIKSQINSSHKNLNILLTDPVETLDPLSIIYNSDWNVASNIFEGLVSFDSKHKIVTELVDTINISANKLHYRFKLKDNIYFHNSPCFNGGRGRKLNSNDVVFTFKRLADKNNDFSNWQMISNKIKGINDFYLGKVNGISGISIIDSLVFEIELLKPFGSFLQILATPNFYIVPREAIDFYGKQFESNPVGTGPFRISEYKKYERVLLVKNKNYHVFDVDGYMLPYLESVEFNTIRENENRYGELLKGKTNFILAHEYEYKQFEEDSLLNQNYSLKSIDLGVGVRFWGFYFDDNGHEDYFKKLRKTIVQNFDKQFIVNNNKAVKIANTLVPPYMLENTYAQNEVTEFKNPTINVNTIIQDTVVIMANMVYKDLVETENTLARLNIPFKRIIKPDNYYGEICNLKPTLFRVSMIPSFPSPIEYYSLFYSGNSSTVNLSNFMNNEYDSLYRFAEEEIDENRKNEAYRMMEKILRDEVAVIYLSHEGPTNYIYSKNLKNLNFKYIIPDFSESYFE